MKDIKLNNAFMKIQYVISWLGFIIFGAFLFWLIAIGLATYGKITDQEVKKKKWVLNKTWQKFVFIYGSIIGDLAIIFLILSLFIGGIQNPEIFGENLGRWIVTAVLPVTIGLYFGIKRLNNKK